jgi:hypothetical protein
VRNSSLKFLAEQQGPLELSTVVIEDGKRLAKRAFNAFSFHFEYDGIPFNVGVDQQVSARSMRLTGDLGPRPFSAEGVWRRVDVQYLITATQNWPTGRLIVDQRQIIQFEAVSEMPDPATPIETLTQVTELILRGKPLMDLARLYLTGRTTPREPFKGLATPS